MKIFVFCTIVLIAAKSWAQTDRKAFTEKIHEICPDADIINIEVKSDYTEVDYLCNGILYETGLDAGKNVIFTETEVDIPKDVIVIIQKKLDKKYYGWVIDEFALIKTTDTSFYKAEMIKSGIEENVYFTLDGKFYKGKNIAANENWNVESLKTSQYYKNAPYNFLFPDKTFDLPEILKEISGIALADHSTLYCIQDETGIVFKYDIQKEELSGMIRFTDKGDFEDISVKNDTAFILRSDGTLFYFNHKNYNGRVSRMVIPLNCMNIEGIFYSEYDNSIYIACKDPLINSYGDNRTIYRVPVNNLSDPKTDLTINLNDINMTVAQLYPGLPEKKLQLNPSAIAIHPVTNEKYILSASNRFIAIYNSKGLSRIYPLPAEIYYKPEGIAFTANGDMYISSEGMKNGYVGGQIFFFKFKN